MNEVTFAVAVNSRDVLRHNLLASSDLHERYGHEILIQEGFRSAASAYNDALARAANDLVICIHQDIYLPPGWLSRLQTSVEFLRVADPEWGLLGAYGVTAHGEFVGEIYSSGLGIIGRALYQPQRVETLDEIILVLRKSSSLRFDPDMPHFHLYGTDICMAARERGLTAYAVPAFCLHNTQQLDELPPEFYGCYQHVKRKWRDHLPIHTSCIVISRSNAQMWKRRLKELYRRMLLPKLQVAPRRDDPLEIAKELDLASTGRNPATGAFQ